MGVYKLLWLVPALILMEFNSAQTQEMCDLSDSPCLTKAVHKMFQVTIAGIKDLFEPLDPYHIDKINGSFNDYHYEQTNVELKGQKDCIVDELKYIIGEQLRYEYYLRCPKLVLDFQYEAAGKVEDKAIDGIILATETLEDYQVLITGVSEIFVSEKDKKRRLFVKTYKIESILKGMYTFENKKLIKGDKDKWDFVVTYLNNNHGKTLVVNVQNPILTDFFDTFMKTVNKHFAAIPLEEVFAKDQK